MDTLEIISKIGPVVTAVTVVVGYFTLKANHDWNRRNYASNMISNWNKQTKPVIDELEKIEPRLIDFQEDGELSEITQEQAKNIYFSKYEEENKEWKLRTKFIHLLNEFEHIASAYKNNVGDRGMIEESFKDIFVKWGYVLRNFINIYKKQRQTQTPWGPYHELYDNWSKKSPDLLKRKKTDAI